MSDTPTSEDLAMAQAGQTAEALADLSRPSAEEQRAADEESAELLQVGVDALRAEDIRPTDIYSRVNTAHGSNSPLVQNPHTFSDDIARGNLPATAIDPHPDAQPPEPDTEEHANAWATEQSAAEHAAYPLVGEDGEPVEGEEGEEGAAAERTGLSPNAPVYPNPAHPMGTPEDLLFAETGVINTTVSNVDGVSIIEVDPNADEIEAPIAGDAAPMSPPPDDKLTSDDTLTEGAPEVEHTGIAGAVEDLTEGEEPEVEQVDSDYEPGDYTVAEVNEYIADHPEEADAIYAKEEAGKARTGILG